MNILAIHCSLGIIFPVRTLSLEHSMAFLARDLQSSTFLPWNSPRHNVSHKQLGGGRVSFISQVTVHHLGKLKWDPGAGTWRQELEQKLQRNTACVPPWLAQLSIFYKGWHCP